ncbi:hypothetical protein BAUCODRAFT_35520 [Baudoinia panamericana UAMH 10762]|uniref:Acid phosphatase n=1 Tax=Baudoinia panamericana (strain UAMH 10762) TaxID=717646 RepID=M2MS53_BAUPA|nr:uncharacterized protein BAUCODRAFT_35520 [Baudoinia panamericana UAMH 10762]EMC94333.1 hypothetical protein BAUCODRAFT_35520 [Baudoinia panamericana UAMH 10762]
MNALALALAISGAAARPQNGLASLLNAAGAELSQLAGYQAATPAPNTYTATSTSAVLAAQATAPSNAKVGPYIPGLAFDRFITIWLENTDYSAAAQDPNLLWLAQQGITLENYFGVTHPSEPNYVAAVGGDNFGMDNDNFNQIDANVSTVVDLLEARSISWATYQECMPYTGFEGFSWINGTTKKNCYVRKHHPTVIYNSNTTPKRLAVQKNLTEFYNDLAAEQLPQWSFITPNMLNDGHDTSVTYAGNWTRTFLEPLLSNEYFMKNTLILVTFDENHTYSLANRVFSFLLGGAVSGKAGTKDSNFYNHYSEIATVEANWWLNTLGRWDVGANVFKNVADITHDSIEANPAVTSANNSVFLNSSFAGPFNSGFQKAPYPAPNVRITSPRTGRFILPAIASTWGNQPSYYNNTVVIPDGQHPPAGYAYNDVSN